MSDQPTIDDLTVSFDLTAVYETVEDGWVQARVEEIPAVVTAAPTREEATVLLLDDLREWALSYTSGRRSADAERRPLHVTVVADD